MESLSSRFSGRFSRNSRTSRSSKAAQQDEVESMTDVDAAITQTLWKNHRLIPPTSRYASYWFSLIICLVMYNAVYIPVELCFGEAQLGAKPPAHIAIDFFVDFLFLIDIAINFRTVYLDEDMEMVLDTKRIRNRYLRGWFALDLFASLPYDVISYALVAADTSGSSSTSELGALGLLKLPRLLRLGKLLKKLDRLSEATMIRVGYILSAFLLAAHWLGCVWWLLGVAEYRNMEKSTDPEYGVSWLARLVNGAPLTPDASLGQAYFSSLYWSLTTLMKTPMVGPDTINEKVFACFAVAVGAILFAIFLTFLSSLTRASQSHSAEKRETIAKLASFAKKYDLPAAETKRLLNHVEAFWTLTSGLSDNKVLAQLPMQLRGEILRDVHADLLHYSSLFKKVSPECAAQLLSKLQTELCLQGELLIRHLQNADKLYMLTKGSLDIELPDAAEGGGGGGGKLGKMCGGGNSAPGGPGASPPATRSSSRLSKMGMKGSYLLEKPGSCLGGSKLFSPEADIYPFNVTAKNSVQLLTIRCSDLEAILSIFGKEQADAFSSQLAAEHKRLIDTMLGANASTERRRSVQYPQTAVPPVSSPSPTRPSAAEEPAPAEPPREDGLQESEVVTMEALKKKQAAKQAEASMPAADFLTRITTLEEHTSVCAAKLERMQKDLSVLPGILDLLAISGLIKEETK